MPAFLKSAAKSKQIITYVVTTFAFLGRGKEENNGECIGLLLKSLHSSLDQETDSISSGTVWLVFHIC